MFACGVGNGLHLSVFKTGHIAGYRNHTFDDFVPGFSNSF